jgi:hypothetical protein
MPSIRHKSISTALFVPGLLAACLALLALPAVALAEEPPAPEPPQLVIEPDHYDFGLQPLNWGSREAWLQLRNAGTEAFQLGWPEIVGPGQEAFWTGGSPCYGSNLQPGESCSVQVNFGPHDAVEYAAQFRVGVGSYSFAADLTGTGGRVTFSTPSNPVDFGVAKVGSVGTTREIEIANTGNMPGGLFIAVVAGGAIGSFQILDENCTGVELLPAATCTLQVRFQPVTEGVKKATLGLFGDNDGPTPIVLTGVGAALDPSAGATGAGIAGTAAAGLPQSTGDRGATKRRAKIRRVKAARLARARRLRAARRAHARERHLRHRRAG